MQFIIILLRICLAISGGLPTMKILGRVCVAIKRSTRPTGDDRF